MKMSRIFDTSRCLWVDGFDESSELIFLARLYQGTIHLDFRLWTLLTSLSNYPTLPILYYCYE
jgi:hypothetical protein